MKNVKRQLKAWLPAAIWCGVIFYFSNQPNLHAGVSPVWDFMLAKSAHVTEYFILALLVYRALKISIVNLGNVKRLYVVGFLSLLYAMSDEFHQTYIIGRTPAIRDIFIDFFGVFLAILIIKYLFKPGDRGK